ncbi:MAG: tetratricopeptide repeat protein [Verrucomicrobiae bacterium]|nr:tetratricopeptide repeat protein [Verrucomicrobiae bacterium]
MKWLLYLLLIALVGGSWMMFSKSGKEMQVKQEMLEEAKTMGEEEQAAKLQDQVSTIEGQRTFNGILLAFLSAGLVGIVFVFQVLPAIAHKVTHAVYDSAEMMEHDVMHDARSLMAQGDYEGAIAAFRAAAAAEPLNRLPIVEIVKIQKDHLRDPASAIQTVRDALEGQAWEPNDAAYFLYRLGELYDEAGDRATAVVVLQQVIDEFPGTRHSANAMHKMHEWAQQEEGVEEEVPAELAHLGDGEEAVDYESEEARIAAEEAEYLARMQAQEAAGQEENPEQPGEPGGSA